MLVARVRSFALSPSHADQTQPLIAGFRASVSRFGFVDSRDTPCPSLPEQSKIGYQFAESEAFVEDSAPVAPGPHCSVCTALVC